MMFMWFSWGLTTAQNSIRTTSDLGRSRLTDTRSAENDRIGADTDPEYRIDASLIKTFINYCALHLSEKYFEKEKCRAWTFYPSIWMQGRSESKLAITLKEQGGI